MVVSKIEEKDKSMESWVVVESWQVGYDQIGFRSNPYILDVFVLDSKRNFGKGS